MSLQELIRICYLFFYSIDQPISHWDNLWFRRTVIIESDYARMIINKMNTIIIIEFWAPWAEDRVLFLVSIACVFFFADVSVILSGMCGMLQTVEAMKLPQFHGVVEKKTASDTSISFVLHTKFFVLFIFFLFFLSGQRILWADS